MQTTTVNEIINVEIKHFGTDKEKAEAKRQVKSKGLKVFNNLAFQHKMIPEGLYQLDLKHMFSNQYNTIGKNEHSGYRIFEYCEILGGEYTRPMGRGYYISKGIEKIRAYQQRVTACGYCAKQHLDSEKVWCDNCTDSEFLEPDNYPLLKLENVCFDGNRDQRPPDSLLKKIRADQRKAGLERIKKDKKRNLEQLKRDIEHAETEYKAFQWLIERDIPFENCIYYSHQDEFCFGWRNSLSNDEKVKLEKQLIRFPYQFKFK